VLCVLVYELGHADALPTIFLRNVTGRLNLTRDVTKASALSSSLLLLIIRIFNARLSYCFGGRRLFLNEVQRWKGAGIA
jgi:hypothetical protein